ncbi:MAG: hypothetical protein ACYCZ2_16460 [Lutibacter sp.]
MKLIEIEDCKLGYILKGLINHKDRGHFIVFIKPYHFPDFIGAMITTKIFDNKNILMSENHFNKNFDDGTDCKITFDNSHLVLAKLHKYFDMGPFELCGVLSESGIKFVEENIKNLDLESWNQYLERTTIKK